MVLFLLWTCCIFCQDTHYPFIAVAIPATQASHLRLKRAILFYSLQMWKGFLALWTLILATGAYQVMNLVSEMPALASNPERCWPSITPASSYSSLLIFPLYSWFVPLFCNRAFHYIHSVPLTTNCESMYATRTAIMSSPHSNLKGGPSGACKVLQSWVFQAPLAAHGLKALGFTTLAAIIAVWAEEYNIFGSYCYLCL